MANLAEDNVVQFSPRMVSSEERVAKTEDGYTRLANELYEELIGANLTRNQAKVAHAICRKTYGFNKKTDRISDSQLAELTRLPRQKVNKAKNELIAMKVIVKVGMEIGPNKNLTEWDIPDCHRNGVIVTKTVTKSVTKNVTALSPKQGHTKDTLTKDKKDNTTHTLQGGEADNLIFRDELIKLLQGKFNCSTAKELHNAVEAEILKSGYLCQREYTVADRGDGRKGKVDLYVTNAHGASCGIELDQKSPREKSIFKLQQLPAGIVMLRETSINEVYEVGGISVVNANEGEIDKKPAGYYQEYLDAYNEEVGDRLPHARVVNSERKRNFKKLIEKLATPNVDGWRAYVRAFVRMAKPFYFGDNDSGWVADIDHLLKEKTLTAVKEGKPSLTGVYQ